MKNTPNCVKTFIRKTTVLRINSIQGSKENRKIGSKFGKTFNLQIFRFFL